MAVLSLAAITALAASTGFPNPALAAAVAYAESRGDTTIVGDRDKGGSYGLWQINIPSHPQFRANPTVLFDPPTNAKAALDTFHAAEKLWGPGQGFRPWSTWKNGAYLQWMPSAPPSLLPQRSSSNGLAVFLVSLLVGVVANGRVGR